MITRNRIYNKLVKINTGEVTMAKITPIEKIDYIKIHEILESEKLTNTQKATFIKENETLVKSALNIDITKGEFENLMSNRPLEKFRPLKNSFTKQGDDILLAQTLKIDKKDISKFINSVINSNFETHNNLKQDDIEILKTYVYRHGTKSQVVAFLEYELSDAKNILQKLYKTLEYNSGGLADYFMRPIHRMSNITMRKLYNTIDKSLKNAANTGVISKEECNSHSEWALVKIYQIQNNSRLLKAFNLYKEILPLS